MKKVVRPQLALAAIFPAVMVPALLPALRGMGASDLTTGVIVGALLGTALLLIALSLKPNAA